MPYVQKLLASLLPTEYRPTRTELEGYRPLEAWFLNPRQVSKSIHDIGHLTRVLILQELLARILLDSGTVPHLDQEALRWAAVTHDIQRKHDYEAVLRNNQAHGIRAAEWVRGRFPRLYPHVSRETIEHIAYINYWHDVRQNAMIERATHRPMTPELKVFKDADRLEWVRLERYILPELRRQVMGGWLLTARDLQYEVSMRLVPVAEALFHESRRKEGYREQPFEAVMAVAEELKILQASKKEE